MKNGIILFPRTIELPNTILSCKIRRITDENDPIFFDSIAQAKTRHRNKSNYIDEIDFNDYDWLAYIPLGEMFWCFERIKGCLSTNYYETIDGDVIVVGYH